MRNKGKGDGCERGEVCELEGRSSGVSTRVARPSDK